MKVPGKLFLDIQIKKIEFREKVKAIPCEKIIPVGKQRY
jgi:hypothetical protein